MEPYQIVLIASVVLLIAAIFWTISVDLRKLYKELDLQEQQILGLYARINETEKMLKDYDWYLHHSKKQSNSVPEGSD